MSRFRFTIAKLMGAVLLAGVVVAASRFSPILGLAAALVAIGVVFADPIREVLNRPVGRLGLAVLFVWIVTAPAVLFFDPATYRPGRRGHVAREPLGFYRLFSDDVAYVAGSRTWERTASNLFVPHNTHIVPVWRLVTWGLVAGAGSLERLPEVLAIASYSILVAVMLLTGRLVARETGRVGLGLAAMVLVGTTSLMVSPAAWFSAGQPLWAGFGILATLGSAQSYRRSGRWPALLAAGLWAPLAGWIWTIGHLAGPVAAVSLWIDGRRRCRRAAAILLAATALAVALSLALAARPMDSRVSFHGRTIRDAIRPLQGILSTAQAIPENLVLGNLGLTVETTPIQGVVLTLALILLWVGRRWRWPRRRPTGRAAEAAGVDAAAAPGLAFNPLECAGAALVLGSYLVEWSFRGYLEYHNLRTLNLRAIVPWYDLIPQLGAVLFAAGWWSGPRRAGGPPAPRAKPARLSRRDALGLGVLALVLVVLNRPRVDALVRNSAPALLPSERELFMTDRLQTLRASALLVNQADWQRQYLRRLDRAEPVARRLRIGRDAIRAAFGHLWVPGAIGGYPPPGQFELYDVAGLLDIPDRGRALDLTTVRAALGPFLDPEKEPRPDWIGSKEPWPP
jgi:hypothetical protein